MTPAELRKLSNALHENPGGMGETDAAISALCEAAGDIETLATQRNNLERQYDDQEKEIDALMERATKAEALLFNAKDVADLKAIVAERDALQAQAVIDAQSAESLRERCGALEKELARAEYMKDLPPLDQAFQKAVNELSDKYDGEISRLASERDAERQARAGLRDTLKVAQRYFQVRAQDLYAPTPTEMVSMLDKALADDKGQTNEQ